MLADAIVAAMEGATVLARAQRSPVPLRNAAPVLTLALENIGLRPSRRRPRRS